VPAVTRADVERVAPRVAQHVRRTPVLELAGEELELIGSGASCRILAKLDLLQPTGSFKVRGATALLTDPKLRGPLRDAGVIAASGGNFGLAVAWAARRLDLRATIVVPSSSPRAKLDPIVELGAELVVVDGVYADAAAHAEQLQTTTGAVPAHPYDQAQVVAGQGTCARELAVQAGPLDTVLVACGGGGLLAGTIAAVDDDVEVVAVETEGTATLRAALAAGEPVDVEVAGIAASSLGARRIGAHAWAARARVAASLTVTDAEVADAQARLWHVARLLAEPGGAVALAALLSGRYVPVDGERVGVILCGANTDPGSVLPSQPPAR
jgi:threonine dehydratase